MDKQDKLWFICRLVIYMAGFIFLLCIPWHCIAGGPVFCLFRKVLGINCPGCGMTRAFWQIVHLNFRLAFHYNAFSLVLFPASAFLIVRDILRGIRELVR